MYIIYIYSMKWLFFKIVFCVLVYEESMHSTPALKTINGSKPLDFNEQTSCF